MIVAFDTGMLSLALHQTARIPRDPKTGVELTSPKKRINALINELNETKATIIIPTPALSEFLVVVHPAGPEYIQTLSKSARFDIAPFDERAAIEAKEMFVRFAADGDIKGGATGDRQKINVDRQIVAIAKVNGAECIYSADNDVISIANKWGLKGIAVWELPLPPEPLSLFATEG